MKSRRRKYLIELRAKGDCKGENPEIILETNYPNCSSLEMKSRMRKNLKGLRTKKECKGDKPGPSQFAVRSSNLIPYVYP